MGKYIHTLHNMYIIQFWLTKKVQQGSPRDQMQQLHPGNAKTSDVHLKALDPVFGKSLCQVFLVGSFNTP